MLAPSFNAASSKVTVNVMPAGPMFPDAGVTCTHGLSLLAPKVIDDFGPGTNTFSGTVLDPASNDTACRAVSGMTTTATTGENGPRSSRQLLTARTR